ncbi:DUF924 domain-containing protein, partial [Burkholderia pseudomallei]
MTAPHASDGTREAAARERAALDSRAREVLDFWFGAPDDPAFGTARPMWFGGAPALDAQLRERFGAPADAAKAGELDAWAGTPPGPP